MAEIPTLSIQRLINYGTELLAPAELALQDELRQSLLTNLKVAPEELALSVAVDEKEPCSESTGQTLLLRFNGRFFPPKKLMDGKEIGLTMAEWHSALENAINDLGLEKTVLGEAAEPLKFTLFVPAIQLPAPEPEKAPEAPPEKEEAPPEEEPAAEPAPEEPAPEEKLKKEEAPKEEAPKEEPEPAVEEKV